MARMRWKPISVCGFWPVLRSFRQSFASLTSHSLPHAVLPPSSSQTAVEVYFNCEVWLVFRSFKQSFVPSIRPSLLQEVSAAMEVLRFISSGSTPSESRLPWKSTLSGNQGCGGSLFQLWILTTPSFLQTDLYSSDHSFAPGWEVCFRCELWLVRCSLQPVLRCHFKHPSTSLRSLKQSFALSSSPSLLQEVQAAVEVYFNCDLSSSPSLLLPVLCSSGRSRLYLCIPS